MIGRLSLDFPEKRFSRVRDFQRAKVYRAESRFVNSCIIETERWDTAFDHVPDLFSSPPAACDTDLRRVELRQAKLVVEWVWGSALVRSHWPVAASLLVPKVIQGRWNQRHSARYDHFYRRIVLLRPGIHPLGILHEIAHALGKFEEGHGEEFIGRLLMLAEHFLGRELGRKLEQCFQETGVKVNR